MGSKAETDNESAAAALPDNDRCNFLRTISVAVPHKVTDTVMIDVRNAIIAETIIGNKTLLQKARNMNDG